MVQRLLTFFENLIVAHALHVKMVDFCILPHLTVWHTVLVSAHTPPNPEKKILI